MKQLPASVKKLLEHDRIFKHGVSVASDVRKVIKSWALDPIKPVGIVDSARLAFEHGLIPRPQTSLAALTELMGFTLQKDHDLRCTTVWQDEELPEAHLHYAARDALSSRLFGEAVEAILCSTKVSRRTPAGTRIVVLSKDGTLPIASGTILDYSRPMLNGSSVTQWDVVVTVDKVLVPAAAVEKPDAYLQDLGNLPFDLVVPYRLLKTDVPPPQLPLRHPLLPEPSRREDTSDVPPGNGAPSEASPQPDDAGLGEAEAEDVAAGVAVPEPADEDEDEDGWEDSDGDGDEESHASPIEAALAEVEGQDRGNEGVEASAQKGASGLSSLTCKGLS